jgi:phage regulator Rha-like protein
MTIITGLEIVLVGREHRIDSRLVAKSLGIEHESFIRTLSTYEAELQELGILRFEIGEIKGRGQPQKYVMLNEDQAIFAATLSRNTRQVITFKLKLTQAFSEVRKRSPSSSVHTLTDALRPRALENLNAVPEGYFSVMGELFKHLYNLEAIIDQALDNKAMIEISVGQHWSTYAREVLQIAEYERHKYAHRCQDGRVVEAWVYPIHYVNTFAKWLWQVYFPSNFPAYQQYRTRRLAHPRPVALPQRKRERR